MSETWSDVSGSYCEDCVTLSMDLEEREMDDGMRTMIEKWHADSCEWCVHGAGNDMCSVRGKECTKMAHYNDAQMCSRLAYLCRNSIRLPPSKASLQTRIVQIIEWRNQ